MAIILAVRAHGPKAPNVLIVSICRDHDASTQRIGSGNPAGTSRVYFDIPGQHFKIRSMAPDLAIGTYHSVVLNDSSAALEIGYGQLSVERELNSAYSIFSEHVDEREVRVQNGIVIGKDRWGYLKSGESWRLVRFAGGDEVGYRPTREDEARLFDHVINSACQLPTTISSSE